MIELNTCIAKKENGFIGIYNKDGGFLGSLPAEDWELIEHGHDPIEEKWEDGNGISCTLNGWAEKLYMNAETGSVGTYDEWWYQNKYGDEVNAVDLGEVYEVYLNINGNYYGF